MKNKVERNKEGERKSVQKNKLYECFMCLSMVSNVFT